MQIQLTKDWVKQKSISTNRPFSNVLWDVMLEDLLFHTITMEKPVHYIFTDDEMLIKPQLEKLDRVIRLCCKADIYLAKEEFIRRVEQSTGQIGWDVIDQDLSDTKPVVRLMVEGNLDEMRVPFVIEINAREDGQMNMDFKSYTGLVRKVPINYGICASEQKLSECISEILSRLELIGSMEAYDTAYQILTSEAVDGRKVADELKSRLKNRQGTTLISKLKEYADYRYMQKRWISYQKNQSLLQKKKLDLEWKEVLSVLISFLEPILESIEGDAIFIGDWMPDLGRFI